MEHGSHLVDLVDERGAVIGTKRRHEIDKARDLYHTVFTFLITPAGEVVLGRIPDRTDLPNMYTNQLGVPVATIRRSDETSFAAAQRSLARELFIDSAEVVPIGEELFRLPGARLSFASVYYLIADMPESYSETDIDQLALFTPRELVAAMRQQPQQFAPTFLKIWDRYHHKLPL